jgi:predicted MFS family arabinose efflux permease
MGRRRDAERAGRPESVGLTPLGLAVGGLAAMAAAIGIGRFVYTPILPLMVQDLGMTGASAGVLASANFAGYLAGALLAATSAVAGSRRRWLLVSSTLSAITTAAMGTVSSLPAFLLLRFLGGAASAFALVFASALVLDGLGAAGRPELSAVHFAGVGVGVAASAVLSWGLSAFGGGWRSIWLAAGALALLAVGLVLALVPDRPGGAPTPLARARRVEGGLATFVVAYGLFGFGYIVTATFLVAIVRDARHAPAFEPLVWLVVGLTAAPSVALWTWVARRLGLGAAFALACVAEAVGVAASVVHTTAAVLLGAALLGGTFMGLTALGLIGGRRLSPGDPRSTLAVMTAAFGLGQIVGPTFAGLVHDATGSFVLPSLVAAGALLLGAALAWAAVPAEGA